jgi:DegV family protein with EDD domain
MTALVGLVTDSNSQITPELVARYGVEVVPLTVTVDGVDHDEGVDLDADGFYARFADGWRPDVSTSQPSPGRFATLYGRLAAAGCDEIVSVHLGAAMSGTVGSASIAAADAPVPVRVVDTGSASFGVSACVWAAGAALAAGSDAAGAAAAVERMVPRIATAFMIGVPQLTERGGRAPGVVLDGDGIPVLGMSGGKLDVLDRVSTVDDTIDVMATYAAAWGRSDHGRDRRGRPAEPSAGRPAACRGGDAAPGRRRDRVPRGSVGGRAHRPGHLRPVRLPHPHLSRRTAPLDEPLDEWQRRRAQRPERACTVCSSTQLRNA